MTASRQPARVRVEVTSTEYGFQWGPATVERLAVCERGNGLYRVLQISTGRRRLDVYISPTGRSVRVFSDGRELR